MLPWLSHQAERGRLEPGGQDQSPGEEQDAEVALLARRVSGVDEDGPWRSKQSRLAPRRGPLQYGPYS